jgi:hypothetical protein
MMKKAKQKLTLDRPATYQIKVPGHLDERWSEWAGGMTVTFESNNDDLPVTTLTGTLDQAALHSILRKIRDLNLQLISVKQVKLDAEDETKTNSNGGVHIDD